MENETEPAKLLLPYLQRADELQKHEHLVAYYCRLYAMERGLRIPQNQRTKTTNAILVSLMNQLEKDKKSLKLGPEDNLYVEGFASNVFSKADKQDRAGRADINTAKTFYAASIFFEILNQFGELQPDLEQKQKYAVWKAADIRKALKEGRKPEPGPPGGEKDLSVPSDTPGTEYDLGRSQSLPPVVHGSGADDIPPHFRHGSGADDIQPHFRHGSGADDIQPHFHHGSGADDIQPHFRHGSGADDVPPHFHDKGNYQSSTDVPASSPSYPTNFPPSPPSYQANLPPSPPSYQTNAPPPPYQSSDYSANAPPPQYQSSDYSADDFHSLPSPPNRTQSSVHPQHFNHQMYPQEPHQPSPPQNYPSHEVPSPSHPYPNFQSYPGFSDHSLPSVPTHHPSYYQGPDLSYPQQSAPPVSSHPSTAQYNSSSSFNGRTAAHAEPSSTSSQTFHYDSNYQPPPEKIAEAHKAARFAVGALAFDDVSVAVDFLRKSLEFLTNPSASQ